MDCVGVQHLHALYFDDELDAEESVLFGLHLTNCPDCREIYDRAGALRRAIRRDARSHVAPAALRQAIREELGLGAATAARPPHRFAISRNALAMAASIMLAVVAGSAMTDFYLRTPQDESVTQAVIDSHVRSLMASHLTDVASSDQHTVKPWFTGKLDASPPAVDLAAEGYPLIGGRLDYVAEHPVAALVYRHDKHLINVFVWARRDTLSADEQTFTDRGFNVVHCNSDDLDYWAVSDMNGSELKDFADLLIATSEPPAQR